MRILNILLLALHIAVPVGLSAQPVVTGSFQFGGLTREYRLYIPAIYSPGTAVPLVFNLHGYGSNNQQQELYGDFRAIADTANFIIAHANGTLDAGGNRFWNTFGGSTVNDLGFITALIDSISAHYSIDADRVYSTGMSNGGFMSHDLACFRSERFAAIASVTGTMIPSRMNTCAATHPTPVMQIHGTADATVPYNGSAAMVPVEALMAHWASVNNCDPVPTITPVPDIVTTDGCTAEHHVYGNGDAGTTVELFKVLGGAHTWPGAFPIGVTNQDIDASVEIWRFFSRYRLSDLLTSVPEGEDALPFSIGPNPSDDVFHLRFDAPAERTITVVNAMGQRVQEVVSRSDALELELEVSGVYLITVREGQRVRTMRVLRS